MLYGSLMSRELCTQKARLGRWLLDKSPTTVFEVFPPRSNAVKVSCYKGTSHISKSTPLGPYRRPGGEGGLDGSTEGAVASKGVLKAVPTPRGGAMPSMKRRMALAPGISHPKPGVNNELGIKILNRI